MEIKNTAIQFELWEECNQHCKFCYLGEHNLYTHKSIKIKNLKNVLNIISDDKLWNSYNTISYLGGEFFQGQLNDQEVYSLFFELMNKTAKLYNSKIIDQLWLYATLTIGNQKDLYDTLNLFNDKSNIWLLTSYDTYGRFHTEAMYNQWNKNMLAIKNKYPEIKFNISTIVTQDLINKYNNNEFCFYDMMKKYNSLIFLKNCTLGLYKSKKEFNKKLPLFYPTRSSTLKFMYKLYNNEPKIVWDKMFNINYRADTLYQSRDFSDYNFYIKRRNKNNILSDDDLDVYCNIQKSLPCGHSTTYQAYIDSDKCILCDKLAIEKSLEA